MNVSAKVEYACLATLELATRFESRQPTPVRAIADAHGIPSQFLVQILLQLKASGLVQSVRGSCGGYRLAIEPTTISLGDVVRAVEGESTKPGLLTSENKSRMGEVLELAWQDIHDQERRLLDAVTLSELAERIGSTTESMYYI